MELVEADRRFASAAIPVMVIRGEDPSGVFARLNLGIPVNNALVCAVDMPTEIRDTVLDLARHPLFDRIHLTAQQVRTGAAVDISVISLACAMGWASPSTTSRDAVAYVTAEIDRINRINDKALEADPDAAPEPIVSRQVIERATTAFDLVSNRLKAYSDYIDSRDSEGKALKSSVTSAARTALQQARKKNVLCAVISNAIRHLETEPTEASVYVNRMIALLTDPKTHLDPGCVVVGADPKDTTAISWPTGKTSSGSSTDYANRMTVLRVNAWALSADKIDSGLPPRPADSCCAISAASANRLEPTEPEAPTGSALDRVFGSEEEASENE